VPAPLMPFVVIPFGSGIADGAILEERSDRKRDLMDLNMREMSSIDEKEALFNGQKKNCARLQKEM